jgi:YesN/AraC family two-component response regulator
MKKRLLLVDDDLWILQGLRRLLLPLQQEWDLAFASNGQEALDLLAHTPVDIVITDIMMPVKEGLETIIAIRRDFPLVKIIAMSGGGSLGTRQYLEIAKALGASCIVQKPFSRTTLLAAIQQVLQSHEPSASSPEGQRMAGGNRDEEAHPLR